MLANANSTVPLNFNTLPEVLKSVMSQEVWGLVIHRAIIFLKCYS